MNLGRAPEIGPEDDRHIDVAGRVPYRLHLAGAKRLPHALPHPGIAAAHQHHRGIDRRRCRQKDHVEASSPQHPGTHARQPRRFGAVQYLDHYAVRARRNRERVALDQFRTAGQVIDRGGKASHDQERAARLQDAGREATRLFQNRTVGSGRIQPERME